MLHRLCAPELGWLTPEPSVAGGRLAGAACARLELTRAANGSVWGSLAATLEGVSYARPSFSLAASGKLSSRVRRAGAVPDELIFEHPRIELGSVILDAGNARTAGFSATLLSEMLRVWTKGPFRAAGDMRLHAENADAALSLFIGPKWLRALAGEALGLGALDGRVRLRRVEDEQRLEVPEARSGRLEAKGYVELAPHPPRGAFLLSSEMANVGIALANGLTDVTPFVSDRWLSGVSL